MGGVAGIPALLSSLSPLPASRWGGGAQHRAAASRGRLLPPHTGAPWPPFSWHGSTALSGPFHHFGGVLCPHSQVEIFKPRPNSHPSGFPYPSAVPCANGAHMYRDAGWRQAQPAKNVVGSLPGAGMP